MKYRYLGDSGLLVSRICLGTMTFGNPDWGCDRNAAVEITHRFADLGGNFVDTADMYSGGVSEEMLGDAVRHLSRDELVIASKCWFRSGQSPNAKGLSRKHIIEACDASLKRMGIEYLDLYQIHGPDPYTPVEETMRALDDLVRSGKVRYIGCSNLFAWQLVKANGVAEKLGFERFVSGQYMYNLLRRDVERDVLPACDDQGMGLLCWSPLASGMLSGKYRGQDKPKEGTRIGHRASVDVPRYWSEESLRVIEEVIQTAQRFGKTPSQVALSWLVGDRRVAAAIIGARTVEQMTENTVCGDWDLPESERDKLSGIVPFRHGYPKEWMDLAFTGTFAGEEFAPRRKQRLP